MKSHSVRVAALSLGLLALGRIAGADNPLILDQFTADPTARVFNGKIFLYASHDIPAAPGRGRGAWFVMEDYHVFSSENLLDWTDHGVIVAQDKTEWTNPAGYAMWAPDCVERNGKFYFYFPAPARPSPNAPARGRGGGGGSRIGVAIAEKPEGPYIAQPAPIAGIGGIDPCVFIDKDGQAYLYVAGGRISVAKLKENMVELADGPLTVPGSNAADAATRPAGRGPSDPRVQVIPNLPTRGLIEGPFVFERNGIYYMTYPHVENRTERLEYAMGPSPLGPFTFAGVIMDELESGCWTNHHSLVQYKGQWILFYHDKDLSPNFDKNRAARADYLTFNPDGTIQKVIPTLRGVGIADAKRPIQVDRFSSKSEQGAAVSFINDLNRHAGWKATLSGKNSWVQYNRVEFGNGLKTLNIRVASPSYGVVEVRLDKADGPLLARVPFEKSLDWKTLTAKLDEVPTGMHDLVVTTPEQTEVHVDWVSFE